jgi:hypothetical protein
MQLNPVNKKKATKELMDRSGEAAKEVVDESYPVPNRWMRAAFVTREDQRVLLLQQA